MSAIELARKGVSSAHYELASDILGREVLHLRDLTEADARIVWTAVVRGARRAA